MPSGVNASAWTFSLSGGKSQQVQLSLNNVATSGTSTVTVMCLSGSLSAQAQFTLTVQVTPGLSLTPLPASISFDPGGSQTVELAITGLGGVTGTVNGTVTGLPAGVAVAQPTFTSIANSDVLLDFTAASTATTSGSATITVTNGTFSATVNLPITVTTAPDFTLSSGIYTSLGVYQSSKSTFSVTATDHNGFNQPIAISFTGLPSGVTFSPASFNLQPGTTQTVQVTSTFVPAPNSTATITMTGVGGGITHQTQFNLFVLAATLRMSIQPATLSVPAGSTGTFNLAVIGTSNGIGTISVQLATPPSGIKISPSNFTTSGVGGQTTIFVEAASNATGGTLTATATYGPLTQSVSLPLSIGPAESITPVALSTADQLVRTDAMTPYTGFPPPNYLIYHAATNRFFSTDAYTSRLNVVDASSHALTAALTIPGAFGLDQAADGSVLYVGTMLGDLYVVDPVNLTVLKRYPSSTISSNGFAANAVYAMADGKLLLEHYFLVPGYSYVDGNGPLALWDPATNDISIFTEPSLFDVASSPNDKPTCFSAFQNAILTNNRTRVLLSAVQTSQGSSQLCSLDPETDTWNLSKTLSGGQGSAFTAFTLTSDGGTVVAYDGYDVYTLDAATFAVKSSFAVPTTQTLLNYPVMFLSQDNSSVFISDPNGVDVLDVYNLASGKLTGWIPQLNLSSPGSYTPLPPIYQAMNSSGVAAGVISGGGIGLLDSTATHALPIGSRFSQTQLDIPYGPVGGGTADSWMPNTVGVPAPPLGSVYFGPNAATGLDNSSFSGMLAAVSPAGAQGPVDVRTFATDGGSQLLPYGFSYGPWVLEAATSYSTAEGGGPGSLFGFGFGPQAYTNSAIYIAAPADLQVTVGGSSATTSGYSPKPNGTTYFTAPPLPYNALLYTVPPGAAGTTATISVGNASGSTSASTKMTYLPALQQYSVAGQLADGIYDSKRDVYYFSDVNQIRVFSLTKGAWLPSIPIPAPKNAYGPQRLFGLALSPDASKLAISDPGAIAIYIVDPDEPSAVQSFPYAAQIFEPIVEEPSGVAVTNNGTVYFTTFDLDGDGGSGYLYALNPSTGKVNEVTGPSSDPYLPTEGSDPDGRLAITADGSRIYFNDYGELGYVDTASGIFVIPATPNYAIAQTNYELALNANQTSFFAAGFITDSNFNSFGMQELNLAESLDADYVYGAAFSADGSLLFQPGTQAIDVFDGRTGAFRARIGLPVQLSPNFRALVSNNQDSRLVAITGATGNGIAVIDLNSLPEPAPLPYLSATAQPASHSLPIAHATEHASGQVNTAFPQAAKVHRRSSSLLAPLTRQRQAESALTIDR
ncbi:hypothetical protein [Edaphobacter aggregans]|uniref:hypothetical protein n=1 Tax=Edaphobacter aggregans TaxID=570835 RepID=UPI000F73F4FC|nr:hypothetical protein [Edaphobacter aggregans]